MNNRIKNNKRVMAVDYGDARTGVAVSDLSAALAGDAWVIHEKRPAVLAQMIVDEAKSSGVGKIVIGYPKNMDGSAGFRAEATESFAKKIQDLINNDRLVTDLSIIEVVFWDERLTTKMADVILISAGKRGKKRKSSVDAVAASLILESYLARQ